MMLRVQGSTEVGVEKILERFLRFICDDFHSPLQDLIQKNGVSPLHIFVIDNCKLLNANC